MRSTGWAVAALTLALLVAQACGPSGRPGGQVTAPGRTPGTPPPEADPAGTQRPAPGSPPAGAGPAGVGPVAVHGPGPAVHIPAGQPALLEPEYESWRLTFATGAAPEWADLHGPRAGEFRLEYQPGQWRLDMPRQAITPVTLPWLEGYFGRATPYPLGDGRILGVTGNIQNAAAVRFVIQDPARGTQIEVGGTDYGLVQIAPAGETAVAYAFFHRDPAIYLGELWQFDWTDGGHTRIAQQGWPVGLLADGRAVAHRGERVGELIAWRASAPERVEALSPPGVQPYWATISPDGRRLVYFQAEKPPIAWWGPAVAHASPQRSSDRPNPRVAAVAVYEVATSRTQVQKLPQAGYINVPAWDAAGNLFVTVQATVGHGPATVVRLSPAGVLTAIYQADDGAYYAGRDGESLLVRHGDEIVHLGAGGAQVPAARAGAQVAVKRGGFIGPSGPLLGLPDETGTTVVDTQTGRRYRAPGLLWPTPLPAFAAFGGLDPASGYVAALVRTQPQAVYRIVRVEPLP